MTPEPMLTILHLALTALAGASLLALFSSRRRPMPAEVWLPASFALGLGLQSSALMLSALPGGRFAFGLTYVVDALGLAGLALLAGARRRLGWGGFACLPAWRKSGHRHTIQLVLFTAAALLLLVDLGWALQLPIVGYDGQAIWNFKAKILFHERSILSEAFTDPYRIHYHRDYPLLLPLAEASIYWLLGAVNEHAVKFLFFGIFAGMAAFCCGRVQMRARNPLVALFFMLWLCAMPVWHEHEYGVLNSGYSDIAISMLALMALSFHESWWRERNPRDLLLGGIFTGLCLQTKNEGVIIWAAITASGLLHSLWGRGERVKLTLLTLTAAGAALLTAAPWLLLKRQTHNLYDEVYGPMFRPENFVPALKRLPLIWSRFREYASEPETWNGLWSLFLLAAAAGLPQGWRKRNLFGEAALLLWLLAYVPVYCFTPLHIDFHTRTSMTRLLAQMMPFALLHMGCIAGDAWRFVFSPRARRISGGAPPVSLHVARNLDVGGISRVLLELLPRLEPQAGWASVLAIQQRGGWADRLESQAVPVSALDIKRLYGPLSLWKLRRRLTTQHPALVTIHWPEAYLPTALALLGTGIPCVLHLHLFLDEFYRLQPKPVRWLGMFFARRAQGLIAVSASVEESARRTLKLPKGRIRVIENAISLPEIPSNRAMLREQIRGQLGVPEGSLLVGMIGRLSRLKRQIDFARAAKIVQEKNPNISFAVIGDGKPSFVEKLKARVKKEGLDGAAQWVGRQVEIEPWLCALDIGVICSKREPFGLTLLEYLAYEIPCVATRVPSFEGVVQDGENGLLVPARAPEQLAGAILRLAGDEPLRLRLSARARASIAAKTWAAAAKQMSAFYGEMLREPKDR